MKNYRQYSFWLDTCGDDLTPRPSLDGSIDVDVAILGAGFSGLWTAYYLLKRAPSLRVAIVESEIAGYGASGRNGGWYSGGYPVPATVLAERYGRASARELILTMRGALDELERVIAEEQLEIDYARGGSFSVALYHHQLAGFEKMVESAAKLDLDDGYTLLDRDATNARVRVAGALGGVHNAHCAVIQPAKLARQLARAVERHGGTIYEQTTVTDYEGGARPRLITARGEVRAKTIVLAGEAYLSRLSKLHRQILPAWSQLVVTEPLTDAQWEEIGWADREALSSPRREVVYPVRTADGRIAFGGGGSPYRFGSRITDAQDRDEPRLDHLQDLTRKWFPMLKDVRFTHRWGGAFGIPRDWIPTIAYDRASGIATARGYSGLGVGTANLAGRVLTDLITEADTPLTRLPVGYPSPNWEPEPLRWLGVRYVRHVLYGIDDQMDRTGQVPTRRTFAEFISGRH